jgi:hypothetical protein
MLKGMIVSRSGVCFNKRIAAKRLSVGALIRNDSGRCMQTVGEGSPEAREARPPSHAIFEALS